MRVQRNNAVSNNMIRMRKEIPTRKCIECGRVFKLYLDHPNVLHCSKECIENNAAKLESKQKRRKGFKSVPKGRKE